jgi:hypothetical protein
MSFLAWLQDTAFSTWIRESDWAIFAFLILHTLGMAFLTGTALTVVLRVHGIAPGIPLSLLSRFVPVMFYGLIVAILSGILLVIGYPAKALTNPLFYVKLTMLVAAWWMIRTLLTRVTDNSRQQADQIPSAAKRLAILSLLLWLAVIVSGKLLAYTHTMLLVY